MMSIFGIGKKLGESMVGGNAQEWFIKGNDAFGRKDFPDAIKCFKKAIEKNPRFADAYFSLGLAYSAIDSYTEVIQCLKTAIDLNFDFPDLYYFLGMAYFKSNNREDGMKYLKKAEQLGSDYAKQWIAAKVPTVTPREAVVHLAEKANEFFEQEYNSSYEIHSIIKTYSELLAKSQMEFLHYRDTTDEAINKLIKPLTLYYDKLEEWIFSTIQSSMMKKFPNRFFYDYQAFSIYDDGTEDLDKLRNVVCQELSNKLMSGFVVELYRSIKGHYEQVLQNDYPFEYQFFSTIDKKGLDGIWNELYGRSVRVVFDCLKSLGIDISLIDMDKIVYGNLDVTGQGGGVNIDKSAILGNVNNYPSIYINKIREKMIEINAGVNIDNGSIVGGSVISKPTVIVGSSNDEVLQSISGLISDIQKSNLEVADNLIGLLQELTQAIQTNNTVKQTETKTEFKGFWRAVGSTVKDVLQASAHLTTVLKYLGII